jgi:hypothetical protein
MKSVDIHCFRVLLHNYSYFNQPTTKFHYKGKQIDLVHKAIEIIIYRVYRIIVHGILTKATVFKCIWGWLLEPSHGTNMTITFPILSPISLPEI